VFKQGFQAAVAKQRGMLQNDFILWKTKMFK